MIKSLDSDMLRRQLNIYVCGDYRRIQQRALVDNMHLEKDEITKGVHIAREVD